MIARIRTILACTESELWQKISQPRALQYVASPILDFVPAGGDELTGQWQIGRTYRLKLYLLKLIPLGWHTIRLVKMDKKTNAISSQESGLLAQVWNHNISFREVGLGKVSYLDEIEIQAGWLTPAIWLFAHLFYRHRQRRWKVILMEGVGLGCRESTGMTWMKTSVWKVFCRADPPAKVRVLSRNGSKAGKIAQQSIKIAVGSRKDVEVCSHPYHAPNL